MLYRSDLEKGLNAVERNLAKNILSTLQKHYPAYSLGWEVTISNSVVYIVNTLLSGKKGFILHTEHLDPEGRKIVNAAGELLERYNQSRRRNITWDQVAHSLLDQKRNFKGELVPER